MYLNRLPMQL